MSTIPTIQVGTGNQVKVITPALLTAIGPDGQPVALKADANGQILTSSGISATPSSDIPPYDLGNIYGTLTPNLTNGFQQYGYITGHTTLNPPSGTTEEMDQFEFMIQYSMEEGIELNFSPLIRFQTDVTSLLPITLEPWKSYLITLRRQGGQWCFISFYGPFYESVD